MHDHILCLGVQYQKSTITQLSDPLFLFQPGKIMGSAYFDHILDNYIFFFRIKLCISDNELTWFGIFLTRGSCKSFTPKKLHLVENRSFVGGCLILTAF